MSGSIATRKPGPFRTVADIRRANQEKGHHWFDPDTLRFFSSRFGESVYGGRAFVSSERSGFDLDTPRHYTVRVAHDDGAICTVGEFGQYEVSRHAHAAAERFVAVLPATCPDCEKEWDAR